MIPAGLCMNCMNGHVVNGVCAYCGARGVSESNRKPYALPFGYELYQRYYIGKVLGSGGFGITYMAFDQKSMRRVALKELYPQKEVTRANDRHTVIIPPNQESYFEHVKNRFLSEARLLRDFIYEKEIINVYHLFPANNTAYYTMEFMEGHDLKSHIISKGPMKWSELRPIAEAVLRQLAIVHRKGMIHRDISPDNIFLLKDGSVRLIDFGSVRIYAGNDTFAAFLKDSFAPVEQYRQDGDQRPWTDIYSLSVTMYYLLSGTLPQKAPSRVTKDEVRHIGTLVHDIPPNVSAAIMKGMSVMPQDRFSSAEEFMRALGLTPTSYHHVSGRYIIRCVRGYHFENAWTVVKDHPISFGREANRAVVFPKDAKGISRAQCTLAIDRTGRLCIRDDNSSYGTYVNNIRLRPNEWQYINEGSTFSFAQEYFQVTLGK